MLFVCQSSSQTVLLEDTEGFVHLVVVGSEYLQTARRAMQAEVLR